MVSHVGQVIMSTTLDTADKVAKVYGGKWEAWGAGRVPVGVNASDSDFSTPGKTGGAKTVTLSTDEIPNHCHDVVYGSNDASVGVTISCTGTGNQVLNLNGWEWSKNSNAPYGNNVFAKKTGGGKAHSNLQPYIAIYMWHRVA